MTEERKNELMKLIEEGKDDVISREDAIELLKVVTDEEKEWIFSQTNKHRLERKHREQFDMEFTQGGRMFELRRLKHYFENDDAIKHEVIYSACKDFFLNRVAFDKPITFEVKDLGKTFYKCPFCKDSINKYQPFCVMCGVMIEWE